MINNIDFVKRVKTLLDIPTTFVWGTSGEIISNEVIINAILAYPKRYDSALISKLHGLVGKKVHCFECTGVVKYCCNKETSILTADEMYEKATKKGLIETLPEIPGILVHMSGHCGVYIGNGEVIEATYNPLFGFGVLKTKLSDRNWVTWYKSHWINYKEEL